MIDSISRLLKQYKANMDSQQNYNASILVPHTKEAWLTVLNHRAVQTSDIYAENVTICENLRELLSAPLSNDTAEFLYQEVHRMYWDGYDDSQLLLPIMEKLITCYEQKEDFQRLAFLYSAAYYEESEVQNRSLGLKKPADAYNHKIIALRSRYSELDEDTRRRIWNAYYNIIVISLANKAIDADTSYQYLKEAMAFWDSEEVQRLDGSNTRTLRMIQRIRNEWLVASEYIDGSSQETVDAFCNEAATAYRAEAEQNADKLNINSEVYSAYLHSLVLKNERTFDSIIDEFFDYCTRKFPQCNFNNLSDEDLYFLINAPLTLEEWLHHCTSKEKAKQIIQELRKLTQETWYYRLNKYSSPFVNETLADWCFRVMGYIDSPAEKEEWLFQLLVRRQLPTYLHSVMVEALAVEVSKELLLQQPELFTELPMLPNDDLIKFIRQCALLHDLGKTKITDIINTQGRNLSNLEFDAIRKHPAYGAELIRKDPYLSQYHDIILGHHKYYDGSAGYPKDFDNTSSPYRILIDLISICDCMDAATDCFDRTYRSAKTFHQILDELCAEKGTRYNPDIVDIIRTTPQLQEKLSHLLTEGRADIMYKAYSEYCGF